MAYWNATVKHDRLGSVPTYVNGGSFAMAIRGPGTSVGAVVGTFTHHGGRITTLDRGANCTNQKYLVADALKAVSTPTTSNGTGDFSVTLTITGTGSSGAVSLTRRESPEPSVSRTEATPRLAARSARQVVDHGHPLAPARRARRDRDRPGSRRHQVVADPGGRRGALLDHPVLR